MANCRQSYNLFNFIKRGQFKYFWQTVKNFDKLVFEDTFMPIVCSIFGHVPYTNDWNDFIETGDVACKRCHTYIKKYKLKYKKLSLKDNIFIAYIKYNYKEEDRNFKVKFFKYFVEISFENNEENYGFKLFKEYFNDRLIACYVKDNLKVVYFSIV